MAETAEAVHNAVDGAYMAKVHLVRVVLMEVEALERGHIGVEWWKTAVARVRVPDNTRSRGRWVCDACMADSPPHDCSSRLGMSVPLLQMPGLVTHSGPARRGSRQCSVQ